MLFAPEHAKQSIDLLVDLQHGFQWRLSTVSAAKINSPLHHALHDAALNEALDSSRIGSSLPRLDAERERTLIYCSQLAEAKDRSLRGADVADDERAPDEGDHAPVIIPPDDLLPVVLASAAARPAVRTADSTANAVPRSVQRTTRVVRARVCVCVVRVVRATHRARGARECMRLCGAQGARGIPSAWWCACVFVCVCACSARGAPRAWYARVCVCVLCA